MRVAALMIVRDEADVLGDQSAHHRARGDRRLLDHRQRLDRRDAGDPAETAAADTSIKWRRDDGPFAQPEMTTALARDAHRAGADWVVAIDADEFWVTANRPLHEILAAASCCGHPRSRGRQLRAGTLGHHRRPGCAAHHDRVAPQSRSAPASRRSGWSSTATPRTSKPHIRPRWCRATTDAISISAGNHGVTGVDGTGRADQRDRVSARAVAGHATGSR